MRSWGNREDTLVVDEPFYAHYLDCTGLEHPGRDEVIAAHERDWPRVVTALLAPVPAGVEILYQKQMSHHLLPHMGREWLGSMTHAFLVRDPKPMLASLAKTRRVRPARHRSPSAGRDLRLRRSHHGANPPVVDAATCSQRRADPPCTVLGAGGRVLGTHAVVAARARMTDGVWASTGISAWSGPRASN